MLTFPESGIGDGHDLAREKIFPGLRECLADSVTRLSAPGEQNGEDGNDRRNFHGSFYSVTMKGILA
jgi:hypothetical protein